MSHSTVRFLAFLLLLFPFLGCGESTLEPDEPSLDLTTLAASGPRGVGSFDFEFVDTSRETPPNGTYAGAAERRLLSRIWYPTASSTSVIAQTTEPPPPATDGPFPLIGYGHGFFSSRLEAQEIAPHLASHGYIVVSVTFPLSNGGAPGGATIADMASQPGDLAFAMTQIEDGVAGAALASAVDTTRCGIAGLSLGGGTVLIGSFHPKWRIENIQAAVAYAPASCFFGPGLYANSLPVLMLSGDMDLLVSLADGPQRVFETAPPPISLITLLGGNHVGFIGLENTEGGNADDVGCVVIGPGGSTASSGAVRLAEQLMEGAGPDAVDTTHCSATCVDHTPQGMRSARQRELTRAATLAHFEANLRGRRAAQRWLDEALGAQNADVIVDIRR